MPASVAVTICTECATTTVITMIGTPELAGLNTVPIQPANPKVVLMTNTTVMTSARVPSIERSRTAVATTMMRNTIGARVSKSSWVASANARFMTTSPVR